MPQVNFGKKDEPALSFQKSENLIAVRTRSAQSLRTGSVPSPATASINDSKLVMAFPEANVEVYQVPEGAERLSLEKRKQALRLSPEIRFAGGVLVDEQSGEPVIYTENIFIKFMDDTDPPQCRKIIHEAGLTIKQEVDYATNAFFVSAVALSSGQFQPP